MSVTTAQPTPVGASGRLLAAAVVAAALVAGLLIGAVPPAAAAVGEPVTYTGHTYPTTVKRPSENKPQSKLWHAHGSWWALMASSSSDGLVRIHRLDASTHQWVSTGVVVDSRQNSTGDALWSAADGRLYVASRHDATNLVVARFAYADGAWRADGAETLSTGGGSESATIDRDTTGRLWVTYTRGSRLWVAVSAPNSLTFGSPYQPSGVDTTLKSDDISALIAFTDIDAAGNRVPSIGVLYSDQQSGAFRFAIHRDGDPLTTWRAEDALAGTNLADDHLNLKQITGDAQGRVFAAVKTSADENLNAPTDDTLVGVLVRKPMPDGTGDWSLVPAGTIENDHTRPIIMVDQTNQELYFFATAPVSGGDIFYKKTSLANPSFETGQGKPFVDHERLVNNASGAKDPVTAQTGMVILAVAEGAKHYVHAEMELAGGSAPPPQDTQAPTVPSDLAATVRDGAVALTWSASQDNVGVTGYRLRRGGTVIATTSGTGYTDTTVTAGGTYSYTVEAVDAAGNASGQSGAVEITVPDDQPPPTGDGIALRAVTTAANTAVATLVVPVPAHEPGDLLLASVDVRGKPGITTPAGWTLLRDDLNGTVMRKATYWRIAVASEPASYTWTFSTKPAAVGTMFAYDGVSATAPVEASAAQANASSKSITAPSVTTVSSDAVVVGLFGIARGATITPPPGMTEHAEIRSPSTVTYPMTGEAASAAAPTPGSTGTRVATSTVSGPSIGSLVVLRPAG